MKLSVIQDEAAAELKTGPSNALGPEPLIVLKFGSSVLQTIGDLPAVAGEIYRQRRSGKRVIAVVSALGDETDRLFDLAAEVAAKTNCTGTAELVSLGEERTAALLRIACDRIGLPAAICRAEELGIHTQGSELDGDFASLQPFALLRKLEVSGVVIVPGFVGTGEHGQRTLLGRGGSDFTAAILGGELGAEIVRLYKDVDGVFETDPAKNPKARKYEEVSYDDALRIARQLIHAKAVAFAAERNLRIEVETIGSHVPTRIGGASRLGSTEMARPLRVALAGYGVVGQAVARRLAADPRFKVDAILVRDLNRFRETPPPVRLTNDAARFSKIPADVLVELLSCEATGAALSAAKLRSGAPVVTASKRMVSERFVELAANAAAGRAELRYSAAVGGSSPLLEAVDQAARHGRISSVRAIVNGTVNFTLQRLNDGASFEEALAEARNAGFAEEDCEADLSGADAAAKLRILAHRAFGILPGEIEVCRHRLDAELAARIAASGERWVQLSELSRTRDLIEARVKLIPASHAEIWAAPDEWNVGVITLEDGSVREVRGRGAGGAATAEAVLADLYDLLEERDRPPEAVLDPALDALPPGPSYATA